MLAKEEGVPYMTVYRLATGESFKKLGSAVVARGDKVKMTPEVRAWIVDVKQRKSWTNTKIAAKCEVSSATVARVLFEERLLLAMRVQSLFMTSGNHLLAKKKHDLNDFQIQSLMELASAKVPSKKLKAQLEE